MAASRLLIYYSPDACGCLWGRGDAETHCFGVAVAFGGAGGAFILPYSPRRLRVVSTHPRCHGLGAVGQQPSEAAPELTYAFCREAPPVRPSASGGRRPPSANRPRKIPRIGSRAHRNGRSTRRPAGTPACGGSAYEQGKVEQEEVVQAIDAAAAVGDDRIQKGAGGQVHPERFTRGSAASRVMWFRRGLESGDPGACDAFPTR